MLFTRETGYAIRALIYLALRRKEEFVPVRSISKELKIPYFFLSKVVQKCVKKGWVSSSRGVNGGVRLAVPPGKISLMEVLQLFGEDSFFRECILALPDCGDHNPCPLHFQWKPLRESLKKVFTEKTLKDLALTYRLKL